VPHFTHDFLAQFMPLTYSTNTVTPRDSITACFIVQYLQGLAVPPFGGLQLAYGLVLQPAQG
jgi:hypothetical protein